MILIVAGLAKRHVGSDAGRDALCFTAHRVDLAIGTLANLRKQLIFVHSARDSETGSGSGRSQAH